MFQLNQAIDQKERFYQHIRDQVEELNRQLEATQKDGKVREEENAQTIQALRKDLKAMKKEKKELEGRLKEQKDLMSSRQLDTLNQSKIMQDKDIQIVRQY